MKTNLKTNLENIRKRITAAEKQYQRQPNSVQLLTVSKTRSVDEIRQAYAAGQRRFGESYVQEALPKIAALKDLAIEWHFVGPIQANKTRAIAENFSWVHSISRLKIAKRLHKQRPSHRPPLNICLEINVSNEPAKSGISITELPQLATEISKFGNLNFRGLMCIPEITQDSKLQRANFHKLWKIFQKLKESYPNLDTLSMGMSADFESAIAEGATIIRIGTAIFHG